MTKPEPNTITQGDALSVLRSWPDNFVHCVVTSPPYYNLRDYGVEGQIGAEETPDQYVEKMVEVFREVRRVLRDDGTLWLNIGDSFWNTNGYARATNGWHRPGRDGAAANDRKLPKVEGLKVKDLVGIPWMLAFALRKDGWYLRSDIIWSKPNPMPESIKDRPTKAHEYIFLLSKSERYFYDSFAVKEEASPASIARVRQANFANQKGGPKDYGATGVNANRSARKTLENFAKNPGRNKRDVWHVAVRPFKGAHFATFPPTLIEPCVLAGASEGGACSQCGTPRERIIEKGEPDLERQIACGGDKNGEYHGKAVKDYASAGAQNASEVKARILAGLVEKRTVGWSCQCEHADAPVTPTLVLDPFMGAGTTGLVAKKHGRNYLGIELNGDYIAIAEKRIAGEPNAQKV